MFSRFFKLPCFSLFIAPGEEDVGSGSGVSDVPSSSSESVPPGGDGVVSESIGSSVVPKTEPGNTEGAFTGKMKEESKAPVDDKASVPPVKSAAPEAKTVNYESKYNAGIKQIEDQNRVLAQIDQLLKSGNVEEINRVFGTKIGVVQAAEEKVNPVDAIASIGTELGLENTDSFVGAIKSIVSPMLQEKNQELNYYKQQVGFLLNKQADRDVRKLRADIPGFEGYESKIGAMMNKYSGMTPQEAHTLVSADDNVENIKAEAVKAYKASIANKEGTNTVLGGGAAGGSVVEKMPHFKGAKEAWDYAKHKIVN